MCIVIDTNAFHAVFNPISQKHGDFRPVLEWIVHGRGKIVYGGDQIQAGTYVMPEKYLGLFRRVI